MRSNKTSLRGPSLGARFSNESGMQGEFLIHIAPFVMNSEKASIAISLF